VPLIAFGLALLSGTFAAQQVRADIAERDYTGFRLQLDNDLFARGGARDRDYTGGLAVTISGRSAQESRLSLDPALQSLDKLFIGERSNNSIERTARQLGVMVFTPKNTELTRAQPDDRPYASLVFIANGRIRVDPDKTSAWFTSFTIGALGLPVAETLHNAVHDAVGSIRPRGYDNQISAGGEPTARYNVARQKLWMSAPTSTLDVKTTVQASVGYLTETSASISVRAGRFSTPWWSFNPELTDYLAAPAPIAEGSRARSDMFFFAGARVKARAYNAFLQGQFRHSEVRHSANEVEPLIAEAWVGFTSQVGQTQLSYTLNYQTAEVRSGPASRDYIWGALQISHRF
jgi:hypothetical protein